MADPIFDRDEWMRRTGPFYPGLVALCSLTCVPLPRGLTPTSDDLVRSGKWFPVLGAAIGVVLALCATLLSWCGVIPAVAAMLVVLAAVSLTGMGMVMGVVRTVERVSGGLVSGGKVSGSLVSGSLVSGDGLSAVGVLALIGFLALRMTALMATDSGEWAVALIFSETVSYWTVLFFLHLIDSRDEPGARDTPPLAIGRIGLPGLGVGSAFAAGVLVFSLILSGVVVLVSVLCTALAAFVAGLYWQRRFGGLSSRFLAFVAGMSGVIVLIAFSAAHPPAVSPWIG